MQNNDQNNWKIVLENPDSFPNESMRDKNEAWEKLYTRLHKKPHRSFMTWYWAAAVLLTVAITTILFFTNTEKHQDALVDASAPVKQQIPVNKESTINTEQKNSGYVLSHPKQKNKTFVANHKNVFVKTILPINKHFVSDSSIEQLPAMVMETELIYDSTIKSVTSTVPVRKKLRVVHVNEIGQPIEYPTVNNRFPEKHSFELRIINGEIYNPVNSSSSNNGLILTKPRTTSN